MDYNETPLIAETWHIGIYTVNRRPNGSYKISGGSIPPKGGYVPSDVVLKQRYDEEMQRDGRMSATTKQYLQMRGIIDTGNMRIVEAKRALGISEDVSSIKLKNGGEVERETTFDEIRGAILSEYPRDLVAQYMAGEPVSLPNVHEWSKKHPRQYRSAHRRWGKELAGESGNGVKRVFDHFYPGSYDKLHKSLSAENVDREKLKDVLISRANRGLSLIKGELIYSTDEHEKILGREILLCGGKSGWYDAIEKLTDKKVRVRDIQRDHGARKIHGIIAEDFTHMFLIWRQVVNGLDKKDVPRKKESERTYHYPNGQGLKEGIADFRVGNTAIEVKTGGQRFANAEIKDLVLRYSPGNRLWESGEVMDQSTIYFHKPPTSYQHSIKALEETGIQIVEAGVFSAQLKHLLGKLNDNYRTELKSLTPPPDLEFLMQAYEDVALKPEVLMRTPNRNLREWCFDMLKALIEKGHELSVPWDSTLF